MKLLPECCSAKCVDDLAAKKWEIECSCDQTWAKIQRKPEQEYVRGSESEESEHESSSPLSRPLFKRIWASAPEEEPGITAIEPLEMVGPRSRWPWVGRPVGSAGPRVGPLVPPFGLLLPQRSITLKIWCTTKSLLEKMFKLFFPNDFKTQKIFLVFLWKGKSARRNSSMQKTILKISNMQWRKTNKVQRKCWKANETNMR